MQGSVPFAADGIAARPVEAELDRDQREPIVNLADKAA